MLTGERAGAVISVPPRGLCVGRGPGVDESFDDPFMSRRHARVFWDRGGLFVDDLGTTNGTYVDGRRTIAPHELHNGDQVRVGRDTLLSCAMHDVRSEDAALALYAASIEDPVTGAHTRRYLQAGLESELTFARRHTSELSLLAFDVDDLKGINDGFGHATGDGVLRVIASAAKRVLRPEDVLARVGGDEFVVLVRGCSPRNAKIQGERIRPSVEALPLRAAGNDFRVTVSVGVASWQPPALCDAADLLAAADRAMYRGKGGGRNRLVAIVIA